MPERSNKRSTQITPLKILGFVALSTAAVAVVAACGGGGGGGEVTRDSFCEERAQQECETMVEFCGLTASTCVEERKAACNARAGNQATPRRIFKPENRSACLSEVKRAYSDDGITADQWNRMFEACDRVWEGSGSLSGNNGTSSICEEPLDCLPQFICSFRDTGFCSEEIEVGRGQFCNNPGETCPDAQFCKKTTSGQWQCVDRGGNGAQCSDDEPCLDEFRCFSGQCSAKLADGEPCDLNVECTNGLCEPFRKVCASIIRFAPGGPQCDGFVDGQDSEFEIPSTPSSPNADGGA